MKESKDVLYLLKEEAENIDIPESITPEKIREKLKTVEIEAFNKKAENQKTEDSKVNKYYLLRYIATAAGICLLLGATLVLKGKFGGFTGAESQDSLIVEVDGENTMEEVIEMTEESIEIAEDSEILASMSYPEITYEDIYESMFGKLTEQEIYNGYRGEIPEGFSTGTGAITEVPASDGSMDGVGFVAEEEISTGVLADSAVSEKNAVKESAIEESTTEYGTTNVQTVGVDEGDVVKNDGRYLYQKIYQEKEHVFTQAIQIVDTKDGLKEIKRIEGFDNIQEFYIWEDVLVIIENKYLQTVQTDSYVESSQLMICGTEDYGSYSRHFHEITFYNIKDRSMPYKIKTFTLKGRYDSSRISEGYFYGFSRFYASPGDGKSDYAAYIPQLDGVKLSTNQILLPEENKGNCYLVLVSIDVNNPTKFTETTAIVTDSDMYYVSSDNIYIADSLGFEEGTGRRTNQISLLRFSYRNGHFALQAEGKAPGSLESSFSMDEYEENLRMVTTVDEYWIESTKDDRTGEVIGSHVTNSRRTNALYVLNPELEIIGKIENLAEGEQIYSARFLGETGYFVTFRQTDPLFSVDLKEPENPKILGELKISGFSEYLHFYGEDRLLGIGMEADEETGSTEGMKLSMFDISNPADVQEISKLSLSNYYYSEVLYNHRAVLISVGANIFGFEVEGQENGDFKKDYLVFSYEDDEFVQRLKIETNNKYGEIYSSRGTFIGNIFYLLTRDGGVKSYDLNTGKQVDSLPL